jgi:enoyl-CoA hydratase/carnithine racemase
VSDIITERSGSIFRIQFNRPTRKNAMTSAMYVGLADLLNQALSDEGIRAVLWQAAGDSFCAGNDVEDFLKNPPASGETPQSRLMRRSSTSTSPSSRLCRASRSEGGPPC